MSDEAYTLDTRGLDQLIKALKKATTLGRIGVLGPKTVRSAVDNKDGLTNAQIGAFAEFGTSKAPQRSFLRIPLMTEFQKELSKSGAFDKEALKAVIAAASFTPWLKKAAIVAEGVVLGAFDSGGYGKWQPSNMQYKSNHNTLIETQQLRNSITSEVPEDS